MSIELKRGCCACVDCPFACDLESNDKEDILEQRCSNYRTVIRSMCNYNDHKLTDLVGEYLEKHILTANDARYIMGLCNIEDSVGNVKKPPLGVMPRDAWDRKRQEELSEAMCRYIAVDKKIPKEWLEEYIEISNRQEKENE